MKYVKKIRLLVLLLFCFFAFKTSAFGKTEKFVTIVNPIRGSELSDFDYDYSRDLNYLKSLSEKFNLKTTWFFRYDAFSKINSLNDLKNNEIGIFFEVTPSLAEKAGLGYPSGGVFWHDANKIFLSGYKPEDRIKLIDTAFTQFKQTIGYFPKSVGAWHIDAYSAGYMQKKYGVTGVLICADQFGTDGYQIWGGWWGVPYYPSKYNILTPAQTVKNKLNTVVYWWAARDPVLGYGGSVNESTYSVQVNDYIQHGLNIDYFKYLMDVYLSSPENEFGQLTIGMENDNNWQKIGDGYEKQLEEVSKKEKTQELAVLTMKDFSQWYANTFKITSPPHFIDGWRMDTNFRVGSKDGNIRDVRIYNELWPETNYKTANPWGTLSLNNPYKIDTVRFEDSMVKADFEINKTNLIKKFGGQKIPFKISTILLLSCYLAILLIAFLLCNNIPLLLLIIIGSISVSIPLVKSGLVYDFGMGFWGPNGHDGIWHISLINQLSKFSFQNPIFSSTTLTNYHFGFDLFAAVLDLITHIPVVNLYFQIIPPIMAILLGTTTFKFVKKWTTSKKAAWWATFFVYFGGSWGWLVSLLKNGTLGGESTFWANQSVSMLINPPYAMSLIILLSGLIKLLDFLEKPTSKNLILCTLLLGVLIQIKVYLGIIIIGGLFILLVIFFILRRKESKLLTKLFFLTFAFSLIVFLPFNLKSISLMVYSPLWFSHTMLFYSDRLGWFKLENARSAYFQSGKYLKWLTAELLAVLIFIVGNLGTRIVGFFYGGFFWRKRKFDPVELLLIFCTVISLIIPLLFIQKGNPWNTIQFFYFFQFFMGIFTGIVMGKWLESKVNKRGYAMSLAAAVLLVSLTLPTTIITLKNDYLPSRPPARISTEELEALKYLQKQRPGVVLSYPYQTDWRYKFSEPKPLYAYETTAYVSALGNKVAYLGDEMNLEMTGYGWQERRDKSNIFFKTADIAWANDFLRQNNIKYIYLVKGQKMNLGLSDINARKIFENGEVNIFEVE